MAIEVNSAIGVARYRNAIIRQYLLVILKRMMLIYFIRFIRFIRYPPSMCQRVPQRLSRDVTIAYGICQISTNM